MYNNSSPESVNPIHFKRLEEKVGMLEAQVQRLNELLVNRDQEVEALYSNLPKTWILSHSYWKRALAAYAYVTVIGLLIGIPIYCIALIIFLMNGSF